MKKFIADFIPCEEIESINVWKENGNWMFSCKCFYKPVDISDLEKSERRERNLLKGYSDEKIKYIVLARAIRDFCYEKCLLHRIPYSLTDPKHVKAHQLVVFLATNFDFSLAEDVMRFSSKGNDTVRRMLASIYKGYVNVKPEYKEIVDNLVEKVDDHGRASIHQKFITNHLARKLLWDEQFEELMKITEYIKKVKGEMIEEKLITHCKVDEIKLIFEKRLLLSDDGEVYIFHDYYKKLLPLKYLSIPVNENFKDWIKNYLEKGKEVKIKFNVNIEVIP